MVRDQRNHDLGLHVDAARRHLARRRGDGAHLHLVDLGIRDAEAAAAVAQHGIELAQRLERRPHGGRVRTERTRQLANVLVGVRQELVQRRIQQADRDGQAVHGLEDAHEVSALKRQKLGQRTGALLGAGGEDHLLHRQDSRRLEEHVLGAAQADALGPELPRHPRVLRRVHVRAHLDRAQPVGPAHELGESAAELRHHRRQAAQHHLALRAVEGDLIAGAQGASIHAELSCGVVNPRTAAADDAGLAHAPCHHGRV